MTGQISGAAHILAIDSADHASLWATLESQYGLAVSRLTGAETALATIQRDRPDLIILNASLTDPSASSLLALFTEQKLTLPVVLIGVNGEVTDKNFNYKHIIGWLNQSFSASDLVALIQAALERSWPTGDLVLAKRAELIEANCQFAHRVQELQTLFEIGKSVTSLLDLEAVLPRVVQAAVYLTDADESYLSALRGDREGRKSLA
jgi:two-component system NtrC family sensor kinase